MTWVAIAGPPVAPVASLSTRIILACIFAVLGAVLAFDVKGAARRIHQANSGFTPWGRRLADRTNFNPARVVGAFFLIGGIVAFISIIVSP